MPNWCENEITITGPKEEIDRFISGTKALPDYYEPNGFMEKFNLEKGEFSFHSLYPIPADKRDDWYDWCIEHWGTKWSADVVIEERVSDEELGMTMETAWSPPLGWFTEAAKQFPALCFRVAYSEPNMQFEGDAEWAKGKMLYHDHRKLYDEEEEQ